MNLLMDSSTEIGPLFSLHAYFLIISKSSTQSTVNQDDDVSYVKGFFNQANQIIVQNTIFIAATWDATQKVLQRKLGR
jgi:hypothetical protein